MNPSLFFRRWAVVHAFFIACTVATMCPRDSGASDPATLGNEKKIVFIAGPCSHPPGTHEAKATARLLKRCIDNAKDIGSVTTAIYSPWPERNSDLNGASTIVFLGDIFPPARMAKEKPEVEAKLKLLMQQGTGIVCLHYATGLRQEDMPTEGEHPLLDWLGGYFAHNCQHHKSHYGIYDVEFVPEVGDHPILRGWKAFECREEIYYNLYFGAKGPGKNVTPLVSCMMPPEKPKKEIIGWAFTRANGGRGVGFISPHFYCNWQLDDMRTLALNSIVWTAKMNVPADGVKSKSPHLGAVSTSSYSRKADTAGSER